METVLGAEIGNQGFIVLRCRGREVRIEGPGALPVALLVGRVGWRTLEVRLVHAPQQQPRIAAGLAPELGIQILEQCARRAVPAEEEIAGELRQPRERSRNERKDLDELPGYRHCSDLLTGPGGAKDSSSGV